MERVEVTGPHREGKHKYYYAEFRGKVVLKGKDEDAVRDYAQQNNKRLKKKEKKSRG
jgi:hypothetical protein